MMLGDFITRDPGAAARAFAEALLLPSVEDEPDEELAKELAEAARNELGWYVDPRYLMTVWEEMRKPNDTGNRH